MKEIKLSINGLLQKLKVNPANKILKPPCHSKYEHFPISMEETFENLEAGKISLLLYKNGYFKRGRLGYPER